MVNKDELARMFSLMVKIRRVEERIIDVFAQGKIPGFIHVSIGQEAVPVGVCSVLRIVAVTSIFRGLILTS